MPYQPSFERGAVWKPLEAIVPTAALASIAICLVVGAHLVVLVSLPGAAPEAQSAGEFLAALWADPFLILQSIATTVVTLVGTVLVLTLPDRKIPYDGFGPTTTPISLVEPFSRRRKRTCNLKGEIDTSLLSKP